MRNLNSGGRASYFGLVAMGIGCMLGRLAAADGHVAGDGALNLVVAFALCIIIELPFAFAYMGHPHLPCPAAVVFPGSRTRGVGAS